MGIRGTYRFAFRRIEAFPTRLSPPYTSTFVVIRSINYVIGFQIRVDFEKTRIVGDGLLYAQYALLHLE